MPKYVGLPDIDTETPEVLEYGPPAEPIDEIGKETRKDFYDDNEAAKENLDTTGLRFDSKIYETSKIDASHSDFSGSLNSKYSDGYHVSTVSETAEARVARLRLEIEQLDLAGVAEAGDLRQLLNNKKLKSNGNSEILYSDLQVSGSLETKKTVQKSNDQSRFAALENKIAKLESRIGISLASSSNDDTMPLSLRLEDMKRRVALLTASPQGLDKSVVKLKNLILTVNELRNAGPALVDDAIKSDIKINSLYSRLEIIEQLSKVLPDVVTRLNSLRRLHADAAYSVSTLSNAESTLEKLHADFLQWQISIENLEKKLIEQDDRNEKNKQSVETYLKEKN